MANQSRGFLEDLGKAFVPKRFRPNLRNYLSTAGYGEVPYRFFGIMFYIGIALTALIYLATNFYSVVSNQGPLLTGLFVFLFWVVVSLIIMSIIMAGVYFYLNMKIYRRIKELESALPDYLVLVSTNLKGGLSFDKSLWSAIKPDFGILAEEMSIVSKKVLTGEDIIDALIELSQKYDSPILKRTLNILLGEIESGGEIAKVLDQIIDNLRKTKMLKEEMSANTLLFTIFIGAIVIVISPLLFALARILLSILIDVSAQIAPAVEQASRSTQPLFTISEINIKADDFRTFSVLALGIISIFASMILSIIQKGEIKAGIKYMPFFIGASMAFYFLFSIVLSGFFDFF